MTGIDRSSPLPLWAQLEAELRARLEAGEFAERFPTDLELVEHYGVSRHTVREAIRHLNSTGILRRERGRGTVVNSQRFEQPMGALYSLFRSIEATGTAQRSEVLHCTMRTDADVAGHLGTSEDSELFFLERLRYADAEPLALDCVWLPGDLGSTLLDVDFERTAVYDELERAAGVRPQEGWERVTPVIPDSDQRKQLKMRRNEAAFFIERLSRTTDRTIEWRTTLVRGERYRLVSEFGNGQQSTLEVQAAPAQRP